jgi:hypothetical protein
MITQIVLAIMLWQPETNSFKLMDQVKYTTVDECIDKAAEINRDQQSKYNGFCFFQFDKRGKI